MDRRRFLRSTGVASVAAVAGCMTGGPGSREAGDGGGGGSGGQTVDEHPATAGIESQPLHGELGGHLVVAFEDPSCPRCGAFHEQTVPKIKSNVVDTGEGAYAFRNYPVVYPWGEKATQALESTFARDGDAFWSLLGHYFENQSEFSADNVLDRTASFLDSETDLDGKAVADDARNEAHGDAVQADLDAADEAGLSGTTPTVLIFRDGQYTTTASGSVSYDVVAKALGE